jgi:hypothetical protein
MLECIIVDFSAFEYISSYILVYIVGIFYCINKHSAMTIEQRRTGTKDMIMKDWIMMIHEWISSLLRRYQLIATHLMQWMHTHR